MRFYIKYLHAFSIVYFVILMILLAYLQSYYDDSQSNAYKVLQLYKKLATELNENTKLDDSGMYKIFYIQKGDDNLKFDITLVSQCSWNHIQAISDWFDSWKGQISVAVFTEVEYVEITLWELAKLFHCRGDRQVALQLVTPVQDKYINDFTYGIKLLSESDRSVSCKSVTIPKSKAVRNYNWTSEYPVNLLRNVAKSQASTDYIMVVDIDMIPSPDLPVHFLSYIRLAYIGDASEKAVFVVPAFEIPVGLSPPKNKEELVEMVGKTEARPFYFDPCLKCHRATNYDEWLWLKKTTGTRICYEVAWRNPWEPFFISRLDVPDYDERFKQYGKNRVSQICELHMAGYKFFVMDNLFLIHRGFKTLKDFHGTKEAEMTANRNLYMRFKEELEYKYPNSKRKC